MIGAKPLDDNERVILTIRKHWLVFSIEALLIAVAALFPLFAYLLMPPSAAEAFAELPIEPPVWIFFYLLWILLTWEVGFVLWTIYFLDIWIEFNRRVIDIEQRGLFSRDTTTLMLEKIQDASVEMRGILPTLFNFGTLIIHTAGENPDITIRFAVNPQVAKDRILECERMAAAKASFKSDTV